MRVVMEFSKAKLKAVFADDQAAAYDKMIADQMTRIHSGGGTSTAQ